MKTIPTVKGHSYSVACDQPCEIKDAASGKLLGTADKGKPCSFHAQSDKTTLSDDSATYTANFNSAPAGSAASGGVSEEDLVELGVLDQWAEQQILNNTTCGSFYGLGTPYPTPYPVQGQLVFTYKLTFAQKFNQLNIVIGTTGEPPIVLVNGMRANFMSVAGMAGELYECVYAFTPVEAREFTFTVIGATAVGLGGSALYCELTSGTLNGGYPSLCLKNVQEVQFFGVQNEIYMFRAEVNGAPALYESRVELDGLFAELKRLGAQIWYDQGSVTSSGEGIGCIGFTVEFSNNKMRVEEVLRDLVSYYSIVNEAGESLKRYRLR